MISALFVEKDGCYFNIPNIDPWDENRDARRYNGPNPVIAHPPCQLWGKFAKINYKRWGGEHNRPGNDGGCFYSALKSVQKWGGVLEHPAQTYAWDEYGLTKPGKNGWYCCKHRDSHVCEVWQSAYGHPCNKKTWLYYVGLRDPFDLDWSRPVGTHQIGFHDQRGKSKNKPTISGNKASATPEKFRNMLVDLVKWSTGYEETQ